MAVFFGMASGAFAAAVPQAYTQGTRSASNSAMIGDFIVDASRSQIGSILTYLLAHTPMRVYLSGYSWDDKRSEVQHDG